MRWNVYEIESMYEITYLPQLIYEVESKYEMKWL